MACDLFINHFFRVIPDPKMSLLMGAAVAIGVTYACVVPWFLCYSNTNEEESQNRNGQESDNNISSADQTLTSTNICITGLRGLNFVSVTIPNHPALTRTSSRSLEASSNLRSISNETSNGEHVSEEYPLITHQDMTRQSSISTIHISSASTDTTAYPLSSKTSLHSLETDQLSRLHRLTSFDSNNSSWDVVRLHDVKDECFKINQNTRPKIRKPPRAHPPNSRFSLNSDIHKQDSLSSLNKLADRVEGKISKKNFVDNETLKANCVVERKLHSINSSGASSKTPGVNLSCDQIKRHSLYPDVVVRKKSSSSTASLYSDDYQRSVDLIGKQDLISECSRSSPGIYDSNACVVDESTCSVGKSEVLSDKSRRKSAIATFIRKKCQKIWMNVNRNDNCENSLKLESSMESITKNIPTSHSTFNENSHLPGEVQGHFSEFKCESEIVQGHCGYCHIKNMNATNIKSNMYKQHFDSGGFPCFCSRNLHETKFKKTSPMFSNIPSFQEKFSNHRSLSCKKTFEYNGDEPLDLSTKSKVYKSDSNTENIGNNIDNNFPSEKTSKSTLKQRSKLIFSNSFNNKFFKKRKCRSLSENNQTNILKSISRVRYHLQQNKNDKTNRNLKDSPSNPELKSIKNTRHISTSGFITN